MKNWKYKNSSIFEINNKKINNSNKDNKKSIKNENENYNYSEINSTIKSKENMSKFPINDIFITSNIEEYNNLYMNKNNIMALIEKNLSKVEIIKKIIKKIIRKIIILALVMKIITIMEKKIKK